MLLDTCIAIDLLRKKEPAVSFITGQAETPSLSVVTVTELIAGVRNANERRQIERLLQVYIIHDITLEIASLAGDYIRQFGPSHSVDALDALIAATAKVHGLELATLNLKHYPMFRGLKRPYAGR